MRVKAIFEDLKGSLWKRSIKLKREFLRFWIIADLHLTYDKKIKRGWYVDQILAILKDLNEELPSGWDFTIAIGDNVDFVEKWWCEIFGNVSLGNPFTFLNALPSRFGAWPGLKKVDSFIKWREIFTDKKLSKSLDRDRVIPIAGNHEYDKANNEATLNTYLKYHYRFFIKHNASEPLSFSLTLGNLLLIFLIPDSPGVAYHTAGITKQTGFASYANSLYWFEQTIEENQDKIIFVFSHHGLISTVSGDTVDSLDFFTFLKQHKLSAWELLRFLLKKGRTTWPWGWPADRIQTNSIAIKESQCPYVKILRKFRVDAWFSGHIHKNWGREDRWYIKKYGTNHFLVGAPCVRWDGKISDCPAGMILELCEESREAKIRFRWFSTKGSEWGYGSIPSTFVLSLPFEFKF